MERTIRTRLPTLQTPSQRVASASKDPFRNKDLGKLEVNIPRSLANQMSATPLRPLQTNRDARNANQPQNRYPKTPLHKNLQPIDKMFGDMVQGKRVDPAAAAQAAEAAAYRQKRPHKHDYRLVDDKDVPDHMKDYKNKKKYKKFGLLGHGGFGKVYHVQSMDEEAKHYAVKILSKASIENDQIKKKLFAEINIHRVLQHDYIVKYYNCFEDKFNVYLLLEICENKTLSNMLKMRKRLTEMEARYYMGQILSALRYMSDNRILHRDLKLGNVLLDKNMDCKIGDFGLAALLLDNSERKRTVCGTPHYIAPEILFDKQNGHNFRVDMWSAGIILYNLLYGKHPFHRDDPHELYQQVRQHQYGTRDIFPSKNYDVSEHARDLISKLLVNDPDARLTVIEALEHPFFSQHPIPDQIPHTALFREPEHHELFGVIEIDTQPAESKVATAIRLHRDRNESYVDNRINPPLQIMQEVILDPRSQYPIELESSQPLNPVHIPTQSRSESSSKKRTSKSNKEEEKDPKRVCSDNDIKIDHVEEVYVEKEVAASQVVKEQVTVEKKEKDMEDGELPNVESLKVNSGSNSNSRPFAIPLPPRNRKPIMEETADNLGIMIDRVKAIPKERRTESIEEDIDFQWGDNNVFVSNWIDCTERYGFSYRLSDGTMGILYNDQSTITTVDNKKYYYIYTRREDSRYIEATYERGKNLPTHLEKKCGILDQFKQYIIKNLPLDSIVTQATELTQIHVFKYIVCKEGLVFRLNNGVIQFNFFDTHDKLVLYDKGKKLIYIDRLRNIHRHDTLDVLSSTRRPIVDAVHTAFGILQRQNKTRQDALSQMRWDRIGKQYDVETSNSPVLLSAPPSPK